MNTTRIRWCVPGVHLYPQEKRKKQKTSTIKIFFTERQAFGEAMSGVCSVDENALLSPFYPRYPSI